MIYKCIKNGKNTVRTRSGYMQSGSGPGPDPVGGRSGSRSGPDPVWSYAVRVFSSYFVFFHMIYNFRIFFIKSVQIGPIRL